MCFTGPVTRQFPANQSACQKGKRCRGTEVWTNDQLADGFGTKPAELMIAPGNPVVSFSSGLVNSLAGSWQGITKVLGVSLGIA